MNNSFVLFFDNVFYIVAYETGEKAVTPEEIEDAMQSFYDSQEGDYPEDGFSDVKTLLYNVLPSFNFKSWSYKKAYVIQAQ